MRTLYFADSKRDCSLSFENFKRSETDLYGLLEMHMYVHTYVCMNACIYI